MIKNKTILVGYKSLFGLLAISALLTEIIVLVDRGRFDPVNFLSFFTVESNLFAAIILIISAIAIARGTQLKHIALLRGAATLYMVTTGVVFSFLLSSLDSDVLTAVPWDNTVLHYIIPIALLIDWLIDPPKNRIAFKSALIWLSYPLAYVAYSLIRGHFVHWYPYPFMNPAEHGYVGVAIVSVGIAVTVLVLTWILLLFTRRKKAV